MRDRILLAWLALILLAAAAHGDVSRCMDAVCRVSAQDGVGTGCVFRQKGDMLHVLTNAHVVGENQFVKVEFFLDGTMSHKIDGRVIFYERSRDTMQDVAVVEVSKKPFGQLLPAIIPLGDPDRVDYAQTITSVGCAKGAWPTAWKGHVLSVETDETLLFRPPPAGGRSGSAIFDAKGEHIIALIAWRDDQQECGVAQTLSNLQKSFRGEKTPRAKRPVSTLHLTSDTITLPLVDVKPREVDCYIGPDGKQYCFPPGQGPPQGGGWRPFGGGLYGGQNPGVRPGPAPEGNQGDYMWGGGKGQGQGYDAWPQLPDNRTGPDEPPTEKAPVEDKQPEQSASPASPTVPVDAPASPFNFSLGAIAAAVVSSALGGAGIWAFIASRLARRAGDRVQRKVVERIKKKRRPKPEPRDGPLLEEAKEFIAAGKRKRYRPVNVKVENNNIYADLAEYDVDESYATQLAERKEAATGMTLAEQALVGQLYQQAVDELRVGRIDCLGGKQTADLIDDWVRKEYLRRSNIKIG